MSSRFRTPGTANSPHSASRRDAFSRVAKSSLSRSANADECGVGREYGDRFQFAPQEHHGPIRRGGQIGHRGVGRLRFQTGEGRPQLVRAAAVSGSFRGFAAPAGVASHR